MAKRKAETPRQKPGNAPGIDDLITQFGIPTVNGKEVRFPLSAEHSRLLEGQSHKDAFTEGSRPDRPQRPKSLAELREWIERRQSTLLECDPATLKVWPHSVADLLDAARSLGLSPPLMPFPLESGERQELLGNIDVLLRWLAGASKPESNGTESRDESAPSVDEYDLKILKTLEKAGPRILFQVEIEADARVPRRTIGKRLKALRDQKLVDRPKGNRGEVITDRGRQVLQAAMKPAGK